MPSAAIADALSINIEPSLARWWDQGLWRCRGGGEFSIGLDPSGLLTDGAIPWPGLMPTNVLPLATNGRGDYLAVRVTDDSRTGDVIHWYHGGGDWIPWGRSWAEAVVVDHVGHRLPGLGCRHALEPPPPRTGAGDWYDAALEHLPPLNLRSSDPGATLADRLLRSGVGTAAVLAGCLIAKPESASTEKWTARAIDEYPGLGWTWEAAGRFAERRGDAPTAIEAYRAGVRCGVFTAQSVRMGTEPPSHVAKFSLERLRHLCPETIEGDAYLRALSEPDRKTRLGRVGDFWRGLADGLDRDDPGRLFCEHQAAHDLGCKDWRDHAEAMRRVTATATELDRPGRAAVARLHLDSLRASGRL